MDRDLADDDSMIMILIYYHHITFICMVYSAVINSTVAVMRGRMTMLR